MINYVFRSPNSKQTKETNYKFLFYKFHFRKNAFLNDIHPFFGCFLRKCKTL